MTNAKRLERIREQCRERGWDMAAVMVAAYELQWAYPKAKDIHDVETIAELLLAATAPSAPVIEIKQLGSEEHGLFCNSFCFPYPQFCRFATCSSRERKEFEPGPDCPGPAPDGYEHVLVLRKVVE